MLIGKDINIRKATPEDKHTIPRLMDIAAIGTGEMSIFQMLLGISSEEERIQAITYLFLNAERVYNHYSRFYVAEVDGDVAASMCLFDWKSDRIVDWFKTLREKGDSLITNIATVYHIFPYSMVAPKAHSKETLVIESVACFPEYRRKGCVQKLLEIAVQEKRIRGYKDLQIASLTMNTPAIKVYEKVGFEIVGTKTNKRFKRLTKDPGYHKLLLKK